MFRPAVVAVLWCGFAGAAVRGDDPTPKGLQVPEGMRAIAVKVQNDQASGLILPGSRVDAIVTERVGEEQRSRVLLRNLLVLAVDTTLPKAEEGKAAELVTVYTVAVKKDDAQKLVLAAQRARVRFILGAPDDDEKKEN